MRRWIFAIVAALALVAPASAQFQFPGTSSGSKSSTMPQFTPFFAKPNFGAMTTRPALPTLTRPTTLFSSFPSFRELFSSRGGPTSQPQIVLPPPKKN